MAHPAPAVRTWDDILTNCGFHTPALRTSVKAQGLDGIPSLEFLTKDDVSAALTSARVRGTANNRPVIPITWEVKLLGVHLFVRTQHRNGQQATCDDLTPAVIADWARRHRDLKEQKEDDDDLDFLASQKTSL